MVERWASDEALAVHGRADAFQGFLAAIDGKLAGRLDVRLVTPVPAGDPEKGAV
jgi:quinol monooxygenase YgiN